MNRAFLNKKTDLHEKNQHASSILPLKNNFVQIKKLIYILSIFILILSSCGLEPEEEITWELAKHPDMLIVESIISNEAKQQAVRLTLSNPYFDSKVMRPVKDAMVTVSDGNNTYIFTASDTLPGFYFSSQSFAAQPAKTYTLLVHLASPVNGIMEYSASSVMPEGIDLDSIQCEIYAVPEFDLDDTDEKDKDSTLLAVYFFGNEPQAAGNYYMNKVYRNKKPLQESAKEYSIFEDSQGNSDYTHLSTFIRNVADNDTITFRLYSVERKYAKFIEGILNIDQTGNAFSMSGPPANTIGNVKNGLGYFLAAYVSEKTAIAKDMR